MNFNFNDFYKIIVDTQNINYNPLKEIKVTNEFYECVIAKCRTEIISEDAPQGLIGKFIGIPIIIDDTIDDDYEFIFWKEFEQC